MKLKGTITALITPFINGAFDEEGMAENIRDQIAQGVDGIHPLGSTGEAATLSSQERTRVITAAVEAANGKVPVWVGAGTFCTKQTIDNIRQIEDLGGNVAVVVVPYYNKPTQEGIYRHFEAIAQKTRLPVVIYNNPSRCGINIETATLARIAELPNIAGIKESSGSINQAGDIIHTIARIHPHFAVFSGDDVQALPMIALGAVGVVSVVSNLIPARIVALVNACLQGQFEEARAMQSALLPIFHAAFIESNPIPIKTAMALCGKPSGECRLPLYKMAPAHLKALQKVLEHMIDIKQVAVEIGK